MEGRELEREERSRGDSGLTVLGSTLTNSRSLVGTAKES